MRRITVWRWIFGLALVPTVLIFWADLDTSAGASFLEHVVSLALAYLGSLLLLTLVVGLAVLAWQVALVILTFMAELLGLRR